MPIAQTQITEALKTRKNRHQTAAAIKQQQRLQLHAKPQLASGQNPAENNFLRWVRELIPEDKHAIFRSLFQHPLPTVGFSEKIFSALEKVFDGKDAVYQYDFFSEDTAADWKEYRKQSGLQSFWRERAFREMRTRINSVCVIDLPKEQQGSRPEPFVAFYDVSSILDYTEAASGFEYIILKTGKHQITVLDDASYRVFELEEHDNTAIKTEILNAPHGLGYCPAMWFWAKDLDGQKTIKKSPISNYISALDWTLFFEISKRHLDLYAPYPIYSGYESECDFETKGGHSCNNGYLVDRDRNYLLDGSTAKRCPVCREKRISGAGSFVNVPIPENGEGGTPDLRNPVQITTVDINSLNYNVTETDRLKTEIYTGVTGYGGEAPNNKAVNEKQVSAMFESRTAALLSLKGCFEKIQRFAEETICRLRYGGSFIGLNIDYGKEFYLFSDIELLEMYEDAKSKGANDSILDDLLSEYHQTRYRNNAKQMYRVRILADLEPLRHCTKKEVSAMYPNTPTAALKADFSGYIRRFERENLPVTEFGEAIAYDIKISRIKEVLTAYASEMIAAPEVPQTIE